MHGLRTEWAKHCRRISQSRWRISNGTTDCWFAGNIVRFASILYQLIWLSCGLTNACVQLGIGGLIFTRFCQNEECLWIQAALSLVRSAYGFGWRFGSIFAVVDERPSCWASTQPHSWLATYYIMTICVYSHRHFGSPRTSRCGCGRSDAKASSANPIPSTDDSLPRKKLIKKMRLNGLMRNKTKWKETKWIAKYSRRSERPSSLSRVLYDSKLKTFDAKRLELLRNCGDARWFSRVAVCFSLQCGINRFERFSKRAARDFQAIFGRTTDEKFTRLFSLLCKLKLNK